MKMLSVDNFKMYHNYSHVLSRYAFGIGNYEDQKYLGEGATSSGDKGFIVLICGCHST